VDVALLALELGDDLLSMGAVAIGAVSTIGSALATIDDVQMDAAILDISLSGGYCFAIADVLRESAVPFVSYTGVDPRLIPLVNRSAPCLMKPLAPKAVVATLFERMAWQGQSQARSNLLSQS
jgi:DNA-binding response OmpR family regulator